MKYFQIALSLFCLSSIILGAQDTIQDKSTGADFPKELTIDVNGKEVTLDATGVATRKKFFVKVYSIASYLQKGASNGDILQAILSDNNAKQLTMKWSRDVELKKVVDAYREGLQKNLGKQEFSSLQNEINQFLSFYKQGAKKGDVHELRWLPGGVIEVIINGQKIGEVKNPQFAKGVWMIWFGNSSVVKRDDLISLVK